MHLQTFFIDLYCFGFRRAWPLHFCGLISSWLPKVFYRTRHCVKSSHLLNATSLCEKLVKLEMHWVLGFGWQLLTSRTEARHKMKTFRFLT